MQRGSYYEAVAAFEKVAQLKPDLAEAYFYIGITYAQYLEDPLSAEEYFLKAVQLNPSYGRAYHGLGLIYISVKKDADKAIQYLSKSVELEPEFAQAQFSLGLAYVMADRRSEVIKTISILRQMNENQLAATLEAMLRGDMLV